MADQIATLGKTALALCLSLFASAAVAQDGLVNTSFSAVPDPGDKEDREFGFRQGGFIAAPILFQDPTFGSGLAVAAGYLFQADDSSSTSFIGLAGFGTTNGSKGYGVGTSLSFDENTWKFKFYGGKADIFYDLYLAGFPIPVRQEGNVVNFNAGYGITPELSLGFGLTNLDTSITLDGPGVLPPELVPVANLNLVKLSFDIDWDRRDDSIFPTRGSLVSFSIADGEFVSSRGLLDENYQKAVLGWGQYYNTRASDVAVIRVTGCSVTDGAPFFDACLLGGTDSFRGFPSTQFIGSELLSVQLAYRGRLTKRLGYEVFFGAGNVYDQFGTGDESGWRKAGGLGVRFRLSEKFPLDYSVDVSMNDEDKELLYVYLGQRF